MTDKPKRTVFLVDDHPLVREWLTNLINQQADLTVCGEAERAPRALQAIGATRPNVAVVDLSLKDSSGIDLIKSLRQAHTSVAVLVLSMHEEALYAERALRAGAMGYIMKRETTRKVIDGIRQVLDGKIFVSDSMKDVLAQRFVENKKPAPRSPIDLLSDRELEVFEMLGQGLGTRQIAESLHLSIKSVQAYCARLKEKLHVDSATTLLREAIRWNETKHSR